MNQNLIYSKVILLIYLLSNNNSSLLRNKCSCFDLQFSFLIYLYFLAYSFHLTKLYCPSSVDNNNNNNSRKFNQLQKISTFHCFFIYILDSNSTIVGSTPLQEMNYYLLIFSCLRSGNKAQARRSVPPRNMQRLKNLAKIGVSYTRFPLPTLLYAAYSVKLISFKLKFLTLLI